jgi:hypothetical protein
MADAGRVTDDNLRHAIELRDARMHAAARSPAAPAKATDPETVIAVAFEAGAGLWALVAGGAAVLGLAGAAPRSMTEDRLTVHLAIALAASATCALSGLLYAIPRRIGAGLRSHALPWLHLILLNAAFALPAWKWHASRLLPEAAWSGTLVATILLHLAWLAALALNLGRSFAPLMRRPRGFLPDLGEPVVPAAAAPAEISGGSGPGRPASAAIVTSVRDGTVSIGHH